jgi:RHS repeat-associated protein
MLLPNRHGSSDSYRYGFQGQEKDDEINGEGNSVNFTFRMHDPRVGRFFAVDPLTHQYPWYTPYSFSGNKVIAFVELEGKEEVSYLEKWEYTGHLGYDTAKSFGNAFVNLNNSINTIWNSGVATVKVLGSEGVISYTEKLTDEVIMVSNNLGESTAKSYDYVQRTTATEKGKDLLNYVSSPRATEDLLTLGADYIFGTKVAKLSRIPVNVKAPKISAIEETTSVVGRAKDIDKLSNIVKNSKNPGGLSRLSNNPGWDKLIVKYSDVANPAKKWARINSEWWKVYNKPWLDDIIKRGDKIKNVSKIGKDVKTNRNLYNKDGSPTHYKREVDYLKKNGYELDGDYWTKKEK